MNHYVLFKNFNININVKINYRWTELQTKSINSIKSLVLSGVG